MNCQGSLLRRVRALTCVFIFGLVISGVTAIPIRWEVEKLLAWLGPNSAGVQATEKQSAVVTWLEKVRDALPERGGPQALLYYGTDWLAFGHFAIALAFVGALRDPVRNRWLFDFGLLACALVIPYALVFGGLRGIPIWWRLVDCSFGALGAVPLFLCRTWVSELECRTQNSCPP